MRLSEKIEGALWFCFATYGIMMLIDVSITYIKLIL